MAPTDPQELLSEFLGAELEALRYGPEEDTWYFVLSCGCLRVDCPWRFARADAVVLGPGDIEAVERPESVVFELPERLRALVAGVAIRDAQVNASGDLHLEFANGAHLQLLCARYMYENWTLDLSGGRYLVAGPGGQLVAGSR